MRYLLRLGLSPPPLSVKNYWQVTSPCQYRIIDRDSPQLLGTIPGYNLFLITKVCKNVIPEAKTIVDTIRAKNPCTVPVFFLTWGKRDGDTQNCANGNYFCTFEGIQDRLTKNYKNLACLNQPARVAPAGEAWRNYSNRDVLFVGKVALYKTWDWIKIWKIWINKLGLELCQAQV